MKAIFEIIKADNGWILHNLEEGKSLFCGEDAAVLAEALRLWLTYHYSRAAVYVKDKI